MDDLPGHAGVLTTNHDRSASPMLAASSPCFSALDSPALETSATDNAAIWQRHKHVTSQGPACVLGAVYDRSDLLPGP